MQASLQVNELRRQKTSWCSAGLAQQQKTKNTKQKQQKQQKKPTIIP
jgi:hypothetical protein